MVTTPVIWKPQHQVNLTDPTPQHNPAVIGIGMGRYLVAWNEDSGGPIAPEGGADMIGQIFDALGNPVGGEFRLNTASVDDNERDGDLAGHSAGGGFAMAYEDTDAAGTTIRFETYDIEGHALPGPTTIAADTNDDRLANPAVAMAAGGAYLVAYERGIGAAGNNIDIVARLVAANGVIGGEIPIYSDAKDARNPDVAALANGNFVVAYEDRMPVGNDFDLRFNIVTPAGAVGGVKSIDTGAGDQTQVKIAALENGGFVAVYREGGAAVGDIYAAVFDNDGNVVKAKFQVADSLGGEQKRPAVAALSDGGFVALWDDDAQNVILGQRFDAAGNEIGGQFIAGQVGNTAGPRIALLDDGRFFAGFEQLTGDEDVWGTIFDPRDEVITGTDEDDVLTSFATGGKVKGKDGDDTLLGVDAADTLIGGKGNDWLAGGNGDDELKGKKGKDCFVFTTDLNKKNNVDHIKDFKAKGKDKIYLLDDVFAGIGGKLNKKELTFGAKADDANDRIIVKEGKKKTKIFYDDDGKGGDKKVLFAKVDDDATIKHKDFKMIDDFVI